MDLITNDNLTEKAVVVGVHLGSLDTLSDSDDETLDELCLLANTAGAEVLARVLQNRPSIDVATYVGQGKLIEIKELCENIEANLLIFDDELSGSQVKNIENITNLKVVDRSRLILDIFARNAKTREGKVQVELAQLKYMLPRLVGIGTSLSRLGGGIGTRGPGETKLETDRRHIRRRISALKEELLDIKNHRDNMRKKRKKEAIPVVALVGYTNAGKSSLLNALTNAGAVAENKLFATLDPLVRHLKVSDTLEILLVDTVGFIRKLPTHLIEAFHSTLEEAVFADLLINVVDSSSNECEKHINVVNKILSEIGANTKNMITAYNKADCNPEYSFNNENSVLISCKTGLGIDKLLKLMENNLPKTKIKATLLIPYKDAFLVSRLHQKTQVLEEEYVNEGIKITAVLDNILYSEVKSYLL